MTENKTNLADGLRDLFGVLAGLAVLAALGWFVWIILPDSWTTKSSTPWNTALTWLKSIAPMCLLIAISCALPSVIKDCHYKKTVTAYNPAGYPVAGDYAPKYAKNAYGNTIISYDEGKTWTVSDTPNLDLTIKTVEIGWSKVKE